MTDPVVYGPKTSTYTRIVRLALAEKGVAYTLQPVDLAAGAHKQAPHLDRHPFGKVPAFAHGEVQLYETAAICRYLDLAFDGPALQPAAPLEHARMTQIICVVDAYAYRPLIETIMMNRLVKPYSGAGADEAAIAAALPGARRAVAALEALVGAEGYAVGDRLTLADLHLFPVLDFAAMTPEGAQLLEQAPRLRALHAAVAGRPSAAATCPMPGAS